MKTRIAAGFVAASVVLGSLSACGGGSSGNTNSSDNSPSGTSGQYDTSATLRVSQVASPPKFDPIAGTSPTVDFAYWSPVYDRLIELKADGTLAPMLATSWQLGSDKLSLDVKLRTGVTFSDGAPFNADAVTANINRYLKADGSLSQTALSNVSGITKISDDEVKFTTKSDATMLPYTLAFSIEGAAMVSPKALQNPASLVTDPVGSGPYKVASVGQSSVTYQRVDNYWDKDLLKTAPKTIQMTGIPDDNARLNALESGQQDVMAIASTIPNVESVAQSNNLKLTVFDKTARNVLMWVNIKHAPLDNPTVRQALSMAIDRSAIQGLLGADACTPSLQPFGKGSTGYDPSLDSKLNGYYNPTKAKQMLQAAGATNLTLKLITNQSQVANQASVALQAALKEVGVKVNIDQQPSNATAGLWHSGSYDVYVAYNNGAPDPEIMLNEEYLGRNSPGGAPDALKQLVAEAGAQPIGSAERNEGFQKVGAYLADNPTNIVVCSFPPRYLSRANVGGVDQDALGAVQALIDTRHLGILK